MDAAATPATETGSPAQGRFTPWQRFLLWLIERAGYLVIWAIGVTMKFAVSWEEGSPAGLDERPFVYSFWHSCMLPAMYFWRHRQVRVMSSDSFDGEYTGRIMQRFGFVKVRGSSSRFAVRALLRMRRELERGWIVAFTLDGPRGPRYVAKPGPVLLAGATGAPMVVFHIALSDAWILNTWDKLMIPKPFSRALMRVSRRMPVPGDAGEVQKQQSLEELQVSLDRVREFAEANVAKAGSAEFPFFDGVAPVSGGAGPSALQ
ncbi:MAG: lysophospholipid acyltransferase family protein [Acidobacteriia bacterium]|nr:lysophospholipid acyltransferase family protein [Terriglobia bacterium]